MLSRLRGAGWTGDYKLSGFAMFGLTATRVKAAVESLPGAERCAKYMAGEPGAMLRAQTARLELARRRAAARHSPKAGGTPQLSAGKGRGKGMKGLRRIHTRHKARRPARSVYVMQPRRGTHFDG